MNTLTFPCPHCSSPLRIQDRAFTDRAVGCPECGEAIEITLDKNKDPIAHKVSPQEEAPAAKLPPRIWGKAKALARKHREKKARAKSSADDGQKASAEKPSRRSQKPLAMLRERFPRIPEAVFSPVVIAWTVAGLVGLILVIMAWPTGEEPLKMAALDGAANAAEHFEDEVPSAIDEGLITEPAPEPPGEIPAETDPNLLAAKYSHLHAGLQSYVDERGHYPQGTVAKGDQPAHKRFSWLAELYVYNSQGKTAEPQWDQPWNDPLNDRFVRQRQEGYLNPLVPNRVGVDRYPAAHFVGVAGVGLDAPALPAHHPRAGIFGIDRVTRPEDIKDGKANTMMLAGVRNQLGSWAAGGNPTIRAFTQEPYFDGPDGFGTGEADGMSVLMADGSVRLLAKNTSPVIIRRMAAMADGWPLDETVPGEPGESPQQKSEPKQSEPKDPPPIVQADPMPQVIAAQKPKPQEEQPVPKPPDPEPPKPLDIPAALAVKIVKFEQIQNVPLKELLFQVEELAGVPIRLADDAPANDDAVWSQGVSLTLKDTTVEGILKALLAKANLSYTIESDHIRLTKTP
jgi:hypothetical protein